MRCGLFIYASHHSKAILPWRMISSGSYDDMYDVLCSKVNPGYDIENAVVYDKVGMPMYRLYLIPYEECDVIQWSDEFGTYKGDSRRYVVKSITYDTMGNGTRFGNISAKSEILRLTKRCQRNRRLEELGI